MRKPTERILVRLEAKKKEEIIKSIGHCRPHVREIKKPNKGTNSTSNPREIQVSTFGKSLRLNSFKILDNPLLETGRAWQTWREDFKEETEYFEIKAVKDKVNALKIYGDKKSRNLPDTAPVEDNND